MKKRVGAHGPLRFPIRSAQGLRASGIFNRTPLQILIVFLFLAHSLFYFFALGTDAVDDAYISFRYAQNAIRGYELVFNPGERVEGFTNFLWTAMMLPLEAAHVDVGRASMLLGALFALGTLWLVFRFAKPGARSSVPLRGVPLLAALLLTADGSFALWAVGGLETAMFAFLIFAGAVLYVREQIPTLRESSRGGSPNTFGPEDARDDSRPLPLVRGGQGGVGSGIFFALAAMTRPEGLLVFAITVAHQAAWRVLAERRLFILRDLERIIAFGALFVPYWLGRWAYYHSFLPNSFYAKVSASGPTAQLERGWTHLAQFVNVHLGWLIVLPPIIAVMNAVREVGRPHRVDPRGQPHRVAPTRAFWTTYFTAIIVLYSAYIVYVGGDWSVGRFFVPLLALFYLLFSTGLVDLYEWFVEARSSVPLQGRGTQARLNNLWIAASVSLAALVFLASSWNGEYGIFIRGFDAARATAARETMGKWLRANVPRGTLIAVDAAGQVPYFAELPAVDMFGINDLYIGRLQVETLGQGTPGHEKFDLGYVIGRAPTFVIIYGTLFDDVKEYERAPVAWTTNPAFQEFLTLYRRRTP